MLGGHVRAVFTLVTTLFIGCVIYTISSFREIPLRVFHEERIQMTIQKNAQHTTYESTTEEDIIESSKESEEFNNNPNPSLMIYLKSIVCMPQSLRLLCLTNLFCWMAHVCYSLYFTDFVGEAVFEGNPTAIPGTKLREQYEQGVRFGCWGMSLYSLSCTCYSLIIEKLILKYSTRRVYIGGLLVYSIGMLLMTLTCNKFGVIVFSWTAGVMYSTLFTVPYLLVSQYHQMGIFEINSTEERKLHIRGLGTDVAIVSSMVFLAQLILSLCMGSIVNYVGSTVAVIGVASGLSLCGAVAATQVLYLD